MSCYQVKEALRSRKPRGCGPGPRRAPARGASGPGPRSPSGGPPVPHGSSAALRRHPRYAARSAWRPPLLRTPGAFRPGCAVARPLRRAPPAAALRCAPAGPPAPPRLSRSASLRPRCAAGLRSALAAVDWPPGRAALGCGLPVRSPLLRSALPSVPARPPAGSPPRGSASRLRPGRLPGPGAARLRRASWWLRPRAFFGARAALAALRRPVSGAFFSWTGSECCGQLVRPGPSRCQRFRPVRCMGVCGPHQQGETGGGRLSALRCLVPPPPSFAIDTLARLR